MVSHREDKEHPAYALLVGKGGPKLKEADPGSAVQPVDKDAPPPKGALVMGDFS